ncbi:hypothetical protein L1987_71528 [Smallanthus sonchifolius]|uniref:Uncharacterized protein n=1 Tax=Smallanthus sonchifolius TaxID=185202 RepID=A0ACB9ATA7_9ASTR|nr:hypothetical protein L1987_71528 [Smallanthus sonchifolius]
MGNNLAVASGGKKKAKVMKIDGEIFKLQTPVKVFEVINNYPGHVLLESNTFKRFGIRANPLGPDEDLEAGKIYFLVELPKMPEMNEKREVIPAVRVDGSGSVQVKVRLPKADVDKLIGESRDEVELTERIVDFCVKKKAGKDGRRLGKEGLMGD